MKTLIIYTYGVKLPTKKLEAKIMKCMKEWQGIKRHWKKGESSWMFECSTGQRGKVHTSCRHTIWRIYSSRHLHIDVGFKGHNSVGIRQRIKSGVASLGSLIFEVNSIVCLQFCQSVSLSFSVCVYLSISIHQSAVCTSAYAYWRNTQ